MTWSLETIITHRNSYPKYVESNYDSPYIFACSCIIVVKMDQTENWFDMEELFSLSTTDISIYTQMFI